jgi:hypothetical protein
MTVSETRRESRGTAAAKAEGRTKASEIIIDIISVSIRCMHVSHTATKYFLCLQQRADLNKPQSAGRARQLSPAQFVPDWL